MSICGQIFMRNYSKCNKLSRILRRNVHVFSASLPSLRKLSEISSEKPLHVPRIQVRNIVASVSRQVAEKGHVQKEEKRVMLRQSQFFDEEAKKARDKLSFRKAIAKYVQRESVLRRGHVEFIYAAMARLKEFECESDLQVYKTLFNVFPKDRMVSRTLWQVEMRHFPKQQECGVDILVEMENNRVIPDDELGNIIVKTFGIRSHVMRRYQRMMYWMPKFKNMNPYPIPLNLPTDIRELAVIALKRICPDYENVVEVYEGSDIEYALDDTFIASAQSPKQQQLIERIPKGEAIFVEGGFNVWLRGKTLKYFILRANKFPESQSQKKNNDEELLESIPFFEEPPSHVVPRPSIHEQDEGIILAVAITGTSSKDSLVSWIKFLERTNTRLEEIPVLFKLKSPEAGLQVTEKETVS